MLYLFKSRKNFPFKFDAMFKFIGNTYALIEGNFRCSGTNVLYEGNCNTLYADTVYDTIYACSEDDCRTFCHKNELCNFYATWYSGHCETYTECPLKLPDDNFHVNLWQKYSDEGKKASNAKA